MNSEQVVVITGASAGVGRAIANELASFFFYIHPKRCDAVVPSIRDKNGFSVRSYFNTSTFVFRFKIGWNSI